MNYLFPLESKEVLLQELEAIRRWEKDQKDLWFWEKIGRLPFVLLDKLIPKKVQEMLGKLLDELGSYIQTGGQYLINDQETLNRVSKAAGIKNGSLSLEEVAHVPLSVLNKVAEETKEHHKQIATMQGATTGFGGIFTLAIDIPALVGISLRVLQEMALIYGYQPREKKERIFIVKCLQFASSDFVGKKTILEQLAETDSGKVQREAISEFQGWREVIINYGDNYGWKKLFQLVPVIGIVFGAIINRFTIEEVAEAGMMLYRKRRIMEKLKIIAPGYSKDFFT
ncbi:MAG: EcsC family protein [Thermoactinomyces sp.]